MENHAKHQYEQISPICEESEMLGIIKFPHDDELERCVLGSLMTDAQALCLTMDTLHKALFYNLAHQVIFEAIKNLFSESKAVDLLTVVDELRREGTLQQAGDAEYVSQLIAGVASTAHIQTHIALLVNKYVQREIVRAASSLIKDASDDTCDPFFLLDKGRWYLERVSDSIVPYENPVPVGCFLGDIADDIEYASGYEYLSIPSGFSSFDTMTHGFQRGTLTVLASKQAMGKTSFALSMARNLAFEFGYHVAFFSYQLKGKGLASRLLSQEMGMPQSHLKNARIITPEKKRLIYDKIKELREMPLYFLDEEMINYTHLRCTCERLMRKSLGVMMIIIDGLPQVFALDENNPNSNRAREMGFIARKLKTLACELNIPILVTTSFDHTTGDIPTLSDLKESGCIDEVADIVIGLHRTEQEECSKDTEGKASLQIMKNKDGVLGAVDIRYNRNSMKFYDPSNPPAKNRKVGDTSVKKKHENPINTSDLPF